MSINGSYRLNASGVCSYFKGGNLRFSQSGGYVGVGKNEPVKAFRFEKEKEQAAALVASAALDESPLAITSPSLCLRNLKASYNTEAEETAAINHLFAEIRMAADGLSSSDEESDSEEEFKPATNGAAALVSVRGIVVKGEDDEESAEMIEILKEKEIVVPRANKAIEESIKGFIQRIVTCESFKASYDLFACFPWESKKDIKESLEIGDALLQEAGATPEERKEFFQFLYSYNLDNPIPNFYEFIKKAVDGVKSAESKK